MNGLIQKMQAIRPARPVRIVAAMFLICSLCGWSFAGGDEKSIVVSKETETIITGALKFLASRQQPTGSFAQQKHQVATTGYVLMAFMAAGQVPDEGEFGAVVSRGAKYLLNCVRADGYIIAPTELTNDKGMYGHGIATIALAEIYGQSRDPETRIKLQKAVNLIVNCQNQQGGWRYMPRVADADISVTVLQVVSLRAAKNAGIDVPQKTIDQAVAYVKSCYKPEDGGFAYQPGGVSGFARTAAAIYSLQVCGLYDDPMVAAGAKYLVERRDKDRKWSVYGNFYAAPAQYMIGGDSWRNWYAAISPTLVQSVKKRGESSYWDRVPGSDGMDEVVTTAVHTLILAMPWQYVPLYQR